MVQVYNTSVKYCQKKTYVNLIKLWYNTNLQETYSKTPYKYN